MKNLKLVCIYVIIGTIGLGLYDLGFSEEQKKPEIRKLLHNQLSKQLADSCDAIIDYVKMPANTTLQWHRHPGEAFHYYLEGQVTIEIEGNESIQGTPGTVGHVPYRALHRAITGESGATVIVFRVHHEDEPIQYTDDPDSKTQ
ncbi:MAG: cupin domain-containing protein [candidate division Zixibacteria bacterium]|nr:cupin domain-containing protein [candidate division Zixibacteria bacterium]MDH3935918.1 cupin domain-containing protein [candidate division Zixibacteria bacterium]MDH4034341.1 cupin domain-containing protein [candidate division Zixibacteria bacterium]